MVVLTKGYRVVPQSLQGGTGFRHVHLKEHRGVFKATRSSEGDDSSQEAVVAKGRTLFVGNVDDQGARPCFGCFCFRAPECSQQVSYECILCSRDNNGGDLDALSSPTRSTSTIWVFYRVPRLDDV